MEKFSVVSPLGIPAVRLASAAPRLERLEGKTIAEFWNGVFKGDQTFPVIRRMLKERFPTLRIVPFTDFPYVPGSDHPARQREHAQRMARLAKEKGVHAVISGNGA